MIKIYYRSTSCGIEEFVFPEIELYPEGILMIMTTADTCGIYDMWNYVLERGTFNEVSEDFLKEKIKNKEKFLGANMRILLSQGVKR